MCKEPNTATTDNPQYTVTDPTRCYKIKYTTPRKTTKPWTPKTKRCPRVSEPPTEEEPSSTRHPEQDCSKAKKAKITKKKDLFEDDIITEKSPTKPIVFTVTNWMNPSMSGIRQSALTSTGNIKEKMFPTSINSFRKIQRKEIPVGANQNKKTTMLIALDHDATITKYKYREVKFPRTWIWTSQKMSTEAFKQQDMTNDINPINFKNKKDSFSKHNDNLSENIDLLKSDVTAQNAAANIVDLIENNRDCSFMKSKKTDSVGTAMNAKTSRNVTMPYIKVSFNSPNIVNAVKYDGNQKQYSTQLTDINPSVARVNVLIAAIASKLNSVGSKNREHTSPTWPKLKNIGFALPSSRFLPDSNILSVLPVKTDQQQITPTFSKYPLYYVPVLRGSIHKKSNDL
ncbi:uncharacterized protein LOC126897264 [Daktulosphaira vitifoliae]|uniref:uncharacterized protein LOC126897264 n=1 Tax=Daktulosphaira vitifoliae TaxID=58002 RepID=UPI0021A9A9B2|nr:uncharacterized protein LOC126897264 [Daktulosphaira vitifoliae]XP_050526713.1 uncharacterized protein LOC126897264 [Daktulosphaira vitifoliae]XP_050526714.1 uncharacterized protein LOC126897264 [Daktulosphaira vitifoliae]